MSTERKTHPYTMGNRAYKELVTSFKDDPTAIAGAVSNYESTMWSEDYRQAGIQAQAELNKINPTLVAEPQLIEKPILIEPVLTKVQPPILEPFPTIEELKERARLREEEEMRKSS